MAECGQTHPSVRTVLKVLPAVLLGLGGAAIACGPASAQTPPSAAEIAAYAGLHAAAVRGDAGGVRTLLAAKTDTEARDGHGRTALHVAAHLGHRDVIRELARAGANLDALDSRRYDVVTIAAVRDDVETLRLVLSLGASARNITSPYDGTALIAAAHLGHAEVVGTLIGAGAPLDHVNNLGWTAAIEAVVLGDGGPRHQATLATLVDAGANTDIGDRDGVTPLDHARRRGFAPMVEILSRPRAVPRR